MNSFFLKLNQKLLSDTVRKKIDIVILYVAIFSFIIHLLLIVFKDYLDFDFLKISDLFDNPIAAIYTPFSFILIYEVYLLIYFLPRSFTTYITKQYEIITLIIIRKLFKDLSALELSSNWFEIKDDLQFTYDLLASLLLFFLIYEFQKRGAIKRKVQSVNAAIIEKFIHQKRIIAVTLVPVFILMAGYNLLSWFIDLQGPNEVSAIKSINSLFFDQFFSVLILVDVILLLISFFYTDQFHKIIRNSGFVVSTILIRMSFGVSGFISTALIVVAVLFGLAIIIIHNQYEKLQPKE